MRSSICSWLVCLAGSVPGAVAAASEGATAPDRVFAETVAPLLSDFCAGCHGGAAPEAELNLEQALGAVTVRQNRPQWHSVLEMLQLAAMPPQGEPQPDAKSRQAAMAWIEAVLSDIDCTQQAYPGRVTLRRLNRSEYNHTIRDLVGVPFRPADDFPSDDVGEGFDNIGDVLSLSPLLLEKYFAAAEQVVALAMKDPATHARILFCQPQPDRSPQQRAREILTAFARRAWRRPVTDQEADRLVQLTKAVEQQGWQGAEPLEVALQAILVSPQFLFRIEKEPTPADPGQVRVLDSHEMASRLSYFLWSSMPDDQLMRLADQGVLQDDEMLTRQVDRMLQDPKAEALVTNFAGQWLALRNLAGAAPDPDLFPDFDEDLRAAMWGETETFIASVIREDRSVLDFLAADYTYVNERLARHYGIEGVSGPEFRKVAAPAQRRGVVTQASVLTLTSNPTRTSPVKRGKWMLENILGTPPPPPPPNVPELNEGELLGTVRERTEQHRADPICASCHQRMDPLGFGLENYDAVGAWREQDGQFPIDASGTLPGGREFVGAAELMETLKTTQSDLFCRCLARKMLTYALGRALQPYDRCAVDEIVKRLNDGGHRFSALVKAIVISTPFRMRGSERGNL